ncbi:MAG: hypothetical protein ACFFDN_42665 [Candidatus Hodarchaeota archaeon]
MRHYPDICCFLPRMRQKIKLRRPNREKKWSIPTSIITEANDAREKNQKREKTGRRGRAVSLQFFHGNWSLQLLGLCLHVLGQRYHPSASSFQI